MKIIASGTPAHADTRPDYLLSSLPSLQDFTKQLDKVSQEIRDVEATLKNCGICVKFIYAIGPYKAWIRGKGTEHVSHFRTTEVLAWVEVGDQYRLVHAEAEQACTHLGSQAFPLSKPTDFEFMTIHKPLIECKAQVRLTSAPHLKDFVKALVQHIENFSFTADTADEDLSF
jgi:hypothetical protein